MSGWCLDARAAEEGGSQKFAAYLHRSCGLRLKSERLKPDNCDCECHR